MSPFDNDLMFAPELNGLGRLDRPMLPPVVRDFDPFHEKLAFTLPSADADADLVLRDLSDGSGVKVFVNGRLVVTLMGCVSDDVPEGCLTFEFED